jgi:uncharacterized protein YjbI with pentapeptide repeats
MTSQPTSTDNSALGDRELAKTPLTAAQLLQRYAAGEKRFREVQLKKVDLKGAKLPQIDLRGADLSNANFREADLSNADLRGACLDGADFYKATLIRVNLDGARLTKTNLKEADLTRVSLENASLEGAFLTKAQMSRADMQGAILTGAHFNEADLSYANLTDAYLDNAYLIQTNLQKANFTNTSIIDAFLSGATLTGTNFQGGYYSEKTNFDVSFDPVGAGLHKVRKVSLEELLAAFRHLSESAIRYFGPKMTAKHWESSRPNSDWLLQQFEVTSSGQIKYSGNKIEFLSSRELQSSQKWIDSFIDSCSKIIQEFAELVDRDKIQFLTPRGSSNKPS